MGTSAHLQLLLAAKPETWREFGVKNCLMLVWELSRYRVSGSWQHSSQQDAAVSTGKKRPISSWKLFSIEHLFKQQLTNTNVQSQSWSSLVASKCCQRVNVRFSLVYYKLLQNKNQCYLKKPYSGGKKEWQKSAHNINNICQIIFRIKT